jgi:hypothetical protein
LELDISGNQIGDKGATGLSEAISKNASITSLSWDENNVNPAGNKFNVMLEGVDTLKGWQSFVSALKSNKTLKIMPRPETDLNKAVAK